MALRLLICFSGFILYLCREQVRTASCAATLNLNANLMMSGVGGACPFILELPL